MISKDEMVEIMSNRQNRFETWLKRRPEKFSIKKFKKEMKLWTQEMNDAKRFAKENDPLFPKYDLGTVYTFLNEAMATQNCYLVSLLYIKKLEKQLSKSSPGTI